MQKKIIAAIFLTSSAVLNPMEREGTTYTSVFDAKPDPIQAEFARKVEENRKAAEYSGINSIDPRTQTTKNTLLEKYITSQSSLYLNKTIPGQVDGPLHIAARSDCDNQTLQTCLCMMKNRSITLNGCDINGNTPLMIACDYRAVNNTHTLAHFLKQSQNLDDADKEYRTALHHICSPTLDSLDANEITRRFACVEALLLNGANPNVLDKKNLTPLCYLATSFFGSFSDEPADTPLSAASYDLFASQRKALISLLIRNKAQTEHTLKRIKKLKETNSSDYLIEFEDHLKAPIQNHNCNLN